MSDSTAISPPLDQLLRMAEVSTELSSLLLLDGAWTAAEHQSIGNGGNTAGIAEIGDRVDAKLVALEESTAFLQELFSGHREWFDQQIETALANDPLDDGRKRDVSALLKGGFESYADNGVSMLERLAPELPAERATLNTKIAEIRKGGDVVTDITEDTACTVAAITGMAMLAACVGLEVTAFCISGGADLLLVMHYCHRPPPTH